MTSDKLWHEEERKKEIFLYSLNTHNKQEKNKRKAMQKWSIT